MEYHTRPSAYTAQGILHMITDGENWLCEKADREELFGTDAPETKDPAPTPEP